MGHQGLIPNVVRRNAAAMRALKCGDLDGAVRACESDRRRLQNMLELIQRQVDSIEGAKALTAEFAEAIQEDPEAFEAACQEATGNG